MIVHVIVEPNLTLRHQAQRSESRDHLADGAAPEERLGRHGVRHSRLPDSISPRPLQRALVHHGDAYARDVHRIHAIDDERLAKLPATRLRMG